ncbi:MAG TPA: IPT/TIG domain-containing protein [Actinospica sp.]|nr:IPT/TIG domain-containing protein [Actinospica sp.]
MLALVAGAASSAAGNATASTSGSAAVGQLIYVSSTEGGITAYDTTTESVVATIPTEGVATDVAFSPDGGTVYATEQASDLAVINVATNTVVRRIPVGPNPTGVAISADGGTAYVANQDGDSVSVVNTASGTVTATIPVGWGAEDVAITPDGGNVYVTNTLDGTVSVISTATDAVWATIPIGDDTQPGYLAFSPDGRTAFVTDTEAGTLSVIDTGTRTVTATVPAGSNPFGLALSANGATVYVADMSGGVTVIDTADDTVAATIPVTGAPTQVAVSADGGSVYVTGFVAAGDSVTVIDAARNTITGRLSGISYGWGVAASPLPRVTKLSPPVGAPAGGNQVTITGVGIGDATGVTFGGVPASSFTAVSPDGIEAVAPSGAVGLVDVTVTTPRGTSPVNPADAYDYLGVPTVGKVSPFTGPAAGGAVVTVDGTGFAGATTVRFGSNAAAIRSETPARLVVVAPAGVARSIVDITVTTPLGTSATGVTDEYVYQDPVHAPPTIVPKGPIS